MSDTPKTDAAKFTSRERYCIYPGTDELVFADFARAQERRIDELECMLFRCEMWLSTIPEGRKMQLKIRALFPERGE